MHKSLFGKMDKESVKIKTKNSKLRNEDNFYDPTGAAVRLNMSLAGQVNRDDRAQAGILFQIIYVRENLAGLYRT
jgi:hypothetical protein